MKINIERTLFYTKEMFLIASFNFLISSVQATHILCKLVLKYEWTIKSLYSAILIQGTCLFFSFNALGIFLLASPIISSLLITASWSLISFLIALQRYPAYSLLLWLCSLLCHWNIIYNLFLLQYFYFVA